MSKANTWHPRFGLCQSTFQTFKLKKQRDYAASVANKASGYLSHEIGEINYAASCNNPRYFLIIYYKEENATQQ